MYFLVDDVDCSYFSMEPLREMLLKNKSLKGYSCNCLQMKGFLFKSIKKRLTSLLWIISLNRFYFEGVFCNCRAMICSEVLIKILKPDSWHKFRILSCFSNQSRHILFLCNFSQQTFLRHEMYY